MPIFAEAYIKACRIDLLKGEMIVSLAVPLKKDANDDLLEDGYELRRLKDLDMPVMAAIAPFIEQRSLWTASGDTELLRAALTDMTRPEPAPAPEPEPEPEPETRDIAEQINDLFEDNADDPLT